MVSITLLAVDTLTLVLTAFGVHGPARFTLALLFAVAVPGWSLIGLLGLDDAALEVSLTIATSLSVLMLVAQILLSSHAWDLAGFEEVACVACIPALMWQTLTPPRHAPGTT
ncbi:MAG TPA: hypothetical protein VL961_05475 [Acidimicrobiales bacterium]|nr:hypothetical protein [Acidimicrobiales bacterium]